MRMLLLATAAAWVVSRIIRENFPQDQQISGLLPPPSGRDAKATPASAAAADG